MKSTFNQTVLTLLSASVLLTSPCFSYESATKDSATPVAVITKVENISAAQSAELIKKHPEFIVIDVRTAKEFAEGSTPNAKNIDVKSTDFETNISKLDKNKTYIVHCKSGGRSTRSLATFKKLGFKHIYHMDGGYLAWQKLEK